MSEALQINNEHSDRMDWFRATSMRLLRSQLQRNPYPGYPSQRLSIETGASPLWDGGRLHLPLGIWDTGSFPNLPREDESISLQLAGNRMDSYGRPLHPWINDMLDPAIGVVTGRGFYRNWGPNYTADPVVVRTDTPDPMLLLIQRKDTGMWALPGGFIDPGETAINAAVREAQEESLLPIQACLPSMEQIYEGPLADVRVTAHAWPETTAVLVRLDPEMSRGLPLGVFQGDTQEVAAAGWFNIDTAIDELFGSHALLVRLALKKL